MIYLNIGTNIEFNNNDRYTNIYNCLKLLQEKKIKIVKISNFFETPSYPDKKNKKFINLSAEIKYIGSPMDLIKDLLLIEKKMGRIRNAKNQPRIIDIDIIDFNGKVIDLENLKIPHPRAHIRNFVLYPLKELNSNWIHPSIKQNIDFFIKKLSSTSRIEITRIKKSDIKLI